jgi:alanine-glyoxylate transaminase/serine-glyoxylate transaminase/serine-pyruvate transaminase
VVHQAGALLLVDAVTSLGGCPLDVDVWGIDLCYSGTQKCLSCPPGLAPVTVNQAALEVIHARKTKVRSWYLDLTMLEKYWGEERIYHHTAPISMNYALHEALRVVQDEGLEARCRRHQRNHAALVAGLTALGLALAAQEGHRLWTLTSVHIPAAVDDATVRRQLLEHYNIEIGAGLGPWRGQVWRIGLMGESSTQHNVLLVLRALEDLLHQQGYRCPPGAGEAAAQAVYTTA